MYSDIWQGEQETTDQLNQRIKILVEKCGYPSNEEKERCQLAAISHDEALQGEEVGKIADSSEGKCHFRQITPICETTWSNCQGTFNDISPTEELRPLPLSMRSEPSQEKAKDLGLEPGPGVRVRYVVSSVNLSSTQRVPSMGQKNVINVEIRTTSVPNVDPNSREEGTDDPAAHPEDVRAKTNASSPGQEVTRWPKAHTA